MIKTLVTGTSGRIGSRLVHSLTSLLDSSAQVDLLQHKTPVQLPTRANVQIVEDLSSDYDLAIHLAAETNPRYCLKPENRKEVFDTNVGLTKKICSASKKVILVSSDNVFLGDLTPGQDYTESSPTNNPHSTYGETKAKAEATVLSQEESVVIRIQAMIGGGVEHPILRNAFNAFSGEDYYPFWTNAWVRPTYFPDFLKVLGEVIRSDEKGIYHVACSGDVLSRAQISDLAIEQYAKQGFKQGRNHFEYEQCPSLIRFSLSTDQTRRRLGLGEFTDSREAIAQQIIWQAQNH